MNKQFAISKNGEFLGSIIADKIVKDESDNYLMFMSRNHCVAMFAAENIEITARENDIETVSSFAEYQSNRI